MFDQDFFIYFKKLNPQAIVPSRATELSSGLDLCSLSKADVSYGSVTEIHTGLALELDHGWEGQVRPRSGLARKHGITVVNTPGTVDSDYRGELIVLLTKLTPGNYTISPKERIAQLVISQVAYPKIIVLNELSETDRGVNGFGSSGSF